MLQGPPRISEVAQHHTFGASETIGGNEIGECHGVFDHVAHNRFGAQFEFTRPWMSLCVDIKGIFQKILKGFGPGDLFDDGHSLGVVHTVCFERGEFFTSFGFLLRDEQLAGVVQN